jgi:hypothetical protein
VAERKAYLLRVDPEVFDALQRWADDELRSVNGQIEFLLRRALLDAGRLDKKKGTPSPRRGRPPKVKPAGEVENDDEAGDVGEGG